MYEISFLAPVFATFFALVNFILVTWNFRNKPWNFKIWLIVSMFFWIPWAGTTIIMRLAPTKDLALLYLRISYISSYVTFYSLFRFHNMLSVNRDSKFLSFFMAVYMGINVGLGMNTEFLKPVVNLDGYYTDSFATNLLLLHVGFTLIVAYLVYRVLKEIDALSIFFSSSSGSSKPQILFSVGLIAVQVVLLGFYILSGGSQDATGFLILSVLVTSFLGFTYGIRPLSSILSPQRLWTFFIISKSGLPIYEYHFSETERIGELALISGAINASNVTLMAFLGSHEPLQEVKLDDRAIIIDTYKETLFCLVADQNSQQVQIVHRDVVKQIIADPVFVIDKHGIAKINNLGKIENYVLNAFSTTNREVSK